MIDCLECRQEFSDQKSLHRHLKKHGGMAAYYQHHYPRRDWFDNEMIFFENTDQYLSAIFNSKENRFSFLNSCSKEDGQKAILHELKKESEKHNEYFFSQSYLKLAELADIKYIKKFFGSCQELSQQLNLKQIYNKKLPKDFKMKDCSAAQILIDTREQKPFSFQNSLVSKLDFGDYTVGGEYFSNTFVDRKSINDFKGTFGVGYERFCNEINRAKDFGAVLYVVVEGTIDGIMRQNEETKFKTNLSYSFHNVREILRQHPHVRFVFCKSREQAKDLTQRILFFGKEIENCDLQYYLDYGMV